MRPALAIVVLACLMPPLAKAQVEHHQHHGQPMPTMPEEASLRASGSTGHGTEHTSDHNTHGHGIGPSGGTYDLRWLDAMVQHHRGALRMGEFVFNIGQPGVGALAHSIWNDQAQEIKAMGQWRKAWYPEAPPYPMTMRSGGNPDVLADLIRMEPAQIEAMRMGGSTPSKNNRVSWFLEGMVFHHGSALQMAHDALAKTSNPTIRRLARQIILAQRREIIALRRMLIRDGFDKPEYYQYDKLFAF